MLASANRVIGRWQNRFFLGLMGACAALYPLALAVLLLCLALYPRASTFFAPWAEAAIRHAFMLSVVTSLVSAAVSLVLAIPCGYILSRYRVPGWRLVDILLYLPIAVPPLVLGVALLIFFQTAGGRFIERNLLGFTFAVPGIVLAQTLVSAAYAVRLCKLAFDGVPQKHAGVARTLGATRWQAFWHIELAEARAGLLEAFLLAWTTAFGSFGPVALFCGITRMRTELLSSSIFLEFSIGNLDNALILSLWMGSLAAAALLLVRGRTSKPLW